MTYETFRLGPFDILLASWRTLAIKFPAGGPEPLRRNARRKSNGLDLDNINLKSKNF